MIQHKLSINIYLAALIRSYLESIRSRLVDVYRSVPYTREPALRWVHSGPIPRVAVVNDAVYAFYVSFGRQGQIVWKFVDLFRKVPKLRTKANLLPLHTLTRSSIRIRPYIVCITITVFLHTTLFAVFYLVVTAARHFNIAWSTLPLTTSLRKCLVLPCLQQHALRASYCKQTD